MLYACPVWSFAAKSNLAKVQIIQNKMLRVFRNGPYYISNKILHNDFKIKSINATINKLGSNFYDKIANHDSNLL